MPFDPISYAIARKAIRAAATVKVTKYIDSIKELYIEDLFLLKPLVNIGITYDEMAEVINSVFPADYWAYRIERGLSTGVDSPSNWATVLNSSSITVGRIASIFNSPIISLTTIVNILARPEIAVTRVRDILSNANLPPDRAQSILYSWVDIGYRDRLLEVITYGAPNANITSTTTLTTGVNRYNNLSISSGVTLNIGAGPGVLITNTLTNSGTIASTWIRGAGGTGAASGGAGRGDIIIFARSITVGTINSNGTNGGNAVNAAGAGYDGGAGGFWEVSGYPAGIGGNAYAGGRGYKNAGGGGYGCYGVNCWYGGNGGNATVTTYTSLASLVSEMFKCLCDWWLINVLGRTPTTYKTLPSLGGSGGGGGAANAGGGGGGGGQVIVIGNSVTAGTINARGGNGGNGDPANYGYGGGGGGGGLIYVAYNSLTGTFTTSVAGGAGGTGYYANGYPGTAGSVLITSVGGW